MLSPHAEKWGDASPPPVPHRSLPVTLAYTHVTVKVCVVYTIIFFMSWARSHILTARLGTEYPVD